MKSLLTFVIYFILSAVLGAITGSFLGSMVIMAVVIFVFYVMWKKEPASQADSKAEKEWQVDLIRLAFNAAQVDGPMGDQEKSVIQHFARVLNAQPADDSNGLWQEGQKQTFQPEDARELLQLLKAKEFKLWYLTCYWLLSVLHADGLMNEKEQAWLIRILDACGGDDEVYARAMLFFTGRDPETPHDSRWAEVLGVSVNADADTIKKAYRQKAQEYHPDKLNGVSEGVRKLAEDKLKEINLAYEQLTEPGMTDEEIVERLAVVDGECKWKPLRMINPGDEVICANCSQKNRLPERTRFVAARCGRCHGYLGMIKIQAEIVSKVFDSPFGFENWK